MAEKKLKEVTILGCGPTHAECDYTHGEIWGVNGVYTFAPKLDKLFMSDSEAEVDACWYDITRLLSYNTTLVLPKEYKRFKNMGLTIEIYPIEYILQAFTTTFFSNSIAYMIAYALLYQFDVIYFYGIDMMTHSTYVQEKGGVEYWMGIADGIRAERVRRGEAPFPLVINTKGSATGKTYNGKMYGYYGETPEELKKEGLFAPWEMIRVGKAADPQDEWILVGNEYKKVSANESLNTLGVANRT